MILCARSFTLRAKVAAGAAGGLGLVFGRVVGPLDGTGIVGRIRVVAAFFKYESHIFYLLFLGGVFYHICWSVLLPTLKGHFSLIHKEKCPFLIHYFLKIEFHFCPILRILVK